MPIFEFMRFLLQLQILMQVKTREFHFQFECGKLVNRSIVELKHLTSWRVCVHVSYWFWEFAVTQVVLHSKFVYYGMYPELLVIDVGARTH